MLEEGRIDEVAKNARIVASAMREWIDKGYDIIALVPSCALMLKFEWPLILPDDRDVQALSKATYDVSEYVVDIARKEGLSSSEVDTLLNTQSGLLGVSGLTNDMRELQAELKEHDDRRVRLAIEIFCYRARKYIGGYLAAMGGADAIVFTGGIGENSPEVRARICAEMDWAGLRVDAEKNQKMVGREGLISTDDSKLLVYAIPTNEELLIARDTVRVIKGEPHPS